MQGENKWTFSEDARRYRGVNTRTGVAVGWFGTGGIGSTGQFDTLPVPQRDNRGGRWMVDSHALYALEEGDRHLREVLHVDAGEWLAGTITWAGEKGVLLTNRRVILLKSAGSALALDGALALPVPFRDLGAVDVAHVADGTLVSLLSGARQYARGGTAQQGVYLFDATGVTRAVGQRTLENEYPALYEHKSWWISPVLSTLIALPDMLIDNGDIPDTRVSTEARPAFVWMAMIAATLLAGGGSVWWVRRAAMTLRARLLWCLACLICGIPALLALMVAAPLPLFIHRRATVPGNHLQPGTST